MFGALLLGCWLPLCAVAADRLSYPVARIDAVQDTYFGTTVKDPYRWLESDDAPDVQAWVQAQNAIARPLLDAYPDREKLKEARAAVSFRENFQRPAKSRPSFLRTIHARQRAIGALLARGHEQNRIGGGGFKRRDLQRFRGVGRLVSL